MPNIPTTPIEGKPNDVTERSPLVLRFADLIDAFGADVDRKYEARQAGRRLGCGTGFAGLDADLGEYLENGLHLVQGAPGAGKTAFGLQMAARCGFPALYISTEMPALELLRRTTARETNTFLRKLKTGELGKMESVRLAMKAAQACPDLAIVDGLKVYPTADFVIRTATALREVCKAESVLIVLDSAQGWIRQRMSRFRTMEYEETNNAIGELCEIADTVRCPVVTINHRNRVGNKEGGGMHSSKGSGDWEYFIETGIDLAPEKNSGPDANGEVPIAATIWKNRNGIPNITRYLKFAGAVQSFREDDNVTISALNGGRVPERKTETEALSEYHEQVGAGGSGKRRNGARW